MRIYEELWNDSIPALQRGEPQLDPYLLNLQADQRRGLSLVCRLPAETQHTIKDFLDSLAQQFPGQHYYRPAELHVTVITLISATVDWRKEFVDVVAFREILRNVLANHPSFTLRFRGVTAARNAVMVQGFTDADTLENIRAEIRSAFVEHGFAGRLDRRYPNRAAHVTAMRFARRETDWPSLVSSLEANRETDFGAAKIENLELILSDWYASTATVELVDAYRLKS